MGTLYFLESTDLFFKSWESTRGEGAVQAWGAGAGDLEAARGEPRAGRRVERDLSPPRSTPPPSPSHRRAGTNSASVSRVPQMLPDLIG